MIGCYDHRPNESIALIKKAGETMSVVIIGGNERMSRQYADVCQAHGCSAKVFPKETGPIEKKIGSPDLMILFTRTVSHKMVQGAIKAAKKIRFPSHGYKVAVLLYCARF